MKLQELFTDESKWTKEAFARNKNNLKVDVSSPFAVCWCIYGGVMKCYGQDGEDKSFILSRILALNNFVSVIDFNDCELTTFEDIKKIIKELDI